MSLSCWALHVPCPAGAGLLKPGSIWSRGYPVYYSFFSEIIDVSLLDASSAASKE